ncbi:cytochrome P450 [Xanthomonas maliensis]|uniref:cytochrome P450 n=1 Tax=Xanthomonas maliensis TaxID=1321368 RepID=UPI00039B335B|nr:cytochrome P450 [Xanthomonas maliensis]KAB7772511.1 cytochrome P450 [Xanthomonas maliensis]
MRAESQQRVPPGPSGHWALGNRVAFRDDPLTFLRACVRDHGEVVKIAAATYVVAAPALIDEILSDTGLRFSKHDPAFDSRRAAFPASMMNCSGKQWRDQRQLLQPAFRSALVREHAIQAAAATQSLLQRLSGHADAVDMRIAINDLCAELGAGFLLGDPALAPQLAGLIPMVDAIMRQTRHRSGRPSWWPSLAHWRLRRAHRSLDAALDRIIAQRRSMPNGGDALLDRLLAHDPHGQSRWCRDELAAMLMSALEPMSAGLSWTLLLLARHPDMAQAVADEAHAVLPSPDEPFGEDRLQHLQLSKACVKEALRLYPPAWMTARIAQQDTVLGGFDVPVGTQLIVSPWIAQRDPRHHVDPDRFMPQRWHAAAPNATMRYSYFPFGAGPRSCIGSALAITQMTVVVAWMLRAVTLQLAAGARPSAFPALVLRPLDVRLHLRPRPATAAAMQTTPTTVPTSSKDAHA